MKQLIRLALIILVVGVLWKWAIRKEVAHIHHLRNHYNTAATW